MQTPFVPAESCNDAQLIFQTLIYSVILYQASNLISNGSEFLLLVPSLAGLVGSIVLPILGAVPDGMMTLCSGLGPDAQNQVSAGVGVLAGSTVMLLTFPWFIAVLYGKVPLDGGGQADYKQKAKPCGFRAGVSFEGAIPKNAKVMLVTTVLYLIIQIPASSLKPGLSVKEQADAVSSVAAIGMAVSGLAFLGYLYICYKSSTEDVVLEKVIEGVKAKDISVSAALNFVRNTSAIESLTPKGGGMRSKHTSHDLVSSDLKKLKRVLRPFFKIYDRNNDSKLNLFEFRLLIRDLGESLTIHQSERLFNEADKSLDGQINWEEFVECMFSYLVDSDHASKLQAKASSEEIPAVVREPDEEEEAEVPEDLAHLNKEEQQRRIIFRACWMMLLGTALVLVFSDPLVDNLGALGDRMGVSPFYVAFVLAPFASNASELLSAYNYALKKTQKSITTSLSTLIGAACMNNTFCLGIFFALIYCKGLAWQFTAEVIAIIMVQWIIGAMAILKKTHTMMDGYIILLCYPFCLFVVWFCENVLGMP